MAHCELQQDAIVDNFIRYMRKMSLVNSSDYSRIESSLRTLCDAASNRKQKSDSAIWVWKYFFERSLGEMSDGNLRGCEELLDYFDEYAEYENLLFALDKAYRDHVIHCIWVMLIGFYLNKAFPVFRVMRYPVHNSTQKGSKKYIETEKGMDEVFSIMEGRHDALWCLIALTHDLGYPIQKTRGANQVMSRMISHFGFLNLKELEYDFMIVHQTAIEQLLQALSYTFVWASPQELVLMSDPGTRLDYAKSFERLDHGIMSAYLVENTIDFICDSMSWPEGKRDIASEYIEPEHAAKMILVSTWLSAMAAHTNANFYTDDIQDQLELLFLCDELDEFSRYARSVSSGDWTDVKCRTELTATATKLAVQYTFDNKDVAEDTEPFFKRKLTKLHGRYSLAVGTNEGLRKVSLTCRDIRKAKADEFTYEKGSKGDELKRTGHKSSHDVRGYLQGRVTLTD